MLSYVIVLVCFVALCPFWGMFQLWLDKHRSDEERKARDGCQGCEQPCGKEAVSP